MKKLLLFAAVLMISFFSINNANAQVNLSINIGSQPVWGPTGYNHVDYYYFPDINAYYNVPSQQYIYLNRGQWIQANSLPAQFSNFDVYRSYKVVINEPKPYLRNQVYVNRYSKFKNYNGKQTIIRDSRDVKYNVVKGHPNYNHNTTVIVKNNRPDRVKKSVIKVNPRQKSEQNNSRGNDYRGSNNRPQRNDDQRVSRRR